MSLFEAEDYRSYLNLQFSSQGKRSGLKAKAAVAISVHTTYLSQILNGRADLSPEQAELMNEFFHHNSEESEFFLLLVLRDRSRLPKLRRRMDSLITSLRRKKINVKAAVQGERSLDPTQHEKFYSSTIYAQIHVLSSIPQFQTVTALAEALRLHPKEIEEKVRYLAEIGVLKQNGRRYQPGPSHVHLGTEFAAIKKHHTNWRLQNIQSFEVPKPDDLHYSACFSLSEKDAEVLRRSFLKILEDHQKIISGSKEETAYVIGLDFYELLR